MANGRTGVVVLKDYDVGVATTIGSTLINIERDDELVQVYGVEIEGVTGPDEYKGLVPVTMADPEDAFQDQFLPQIVISRGAITPAMARWFPGGREYQVAAVGSEQVVGPGGRSMPNRIERKYWTYPFEISYDVHLRAKLRWQADHMLQHVGRYFWAYGQVFLRDSEGEERGYYAFTESYDSLSEITDVADRLQGHTISMRVEAELDFFEPIILPTSHRFTVTVERHDT
jgi:hypothetical protein